MTTTTATDERILAALRYGPKYELVLRLEVGGPRAHVAAALRRLVERGEIVRIDDGSGARMYRRRRTP